MTQDPAVDLDWLSASRSAALLFLVLTWWLISSLAFLQDGGRTLRKVESNALGKTASDQPLRKHFSSCTRQERFYR
jgi:hypothetical protein